MVQYKSGEWYKNLRKQRRLSLQEVASRAGISLSMLDNIENGKTMPAAIMRRLMNALGLPEALVDMDSKECVKELEELLASSTAERECFLEYIDLGGYVYYIDFDLDKKELETASKAKIDSEYGTYTKGIERTNLKTALHQFKKQC